MHSRVASRLNKKAVSLVPVTSFLPALSNDKVASAGKRDGVSVGPGREVDAASSLVVLSIVLATMIVVGSELKVGEVVG